MACRQLKADRPQRRVHAPVQAASNILLQARLSVDSVTKIQISSLRENRSIEDFSFTDTIDDAVTVATLSIRRTALQGAFLRRAYRPQPVKRG